MCKVIGAFRGYGNAAQSCECKNLIIGVTVTCQFEQRYIKKSCLGSSELCECVLV